MKSHESKMNRLSSSLSSSPTLSRLFQNDDFLFYQFQKRWASFVGPEAAEESSIERKNGHTLFVSVYASVWLHRLFTMRRVILENIRKDSYGSHFRDIRFHIGTKPIERKLPGVVEEKNIPPVSLTEDEKERIRYWTENRISSLPLQPVFRKFTEALYKKRKEDIRRGYHPCPTCGILCPPSQSQCLYCQEKEKRKVQNLVILLLKEEPHLHYDEVRERLGATYDSFSFARSLLIHRYKDRYYLHHATKEEQKILTALLLYRPVSSLTEAEVEQALRAFPQKKFFP